MISLQLVNNKLDTRASATMRLQRQHVRMVCTYALRVSLPV